MRILVLSGLPGSGKSTHAQKLAGQLKRVDIISADDYFNQPDGSWAFDPTKIGEAHASCMRRFVQRCLVPHDDVDTVIVDNTSLSVAEIAPYMAVASAYGHSAEVVRIKCNPNIAFERQSHGVPFNTFMHMFANQRELVLPPWWVVSEVNV